MNVARRRESVFQVALERVDELARSICGQLPLDPHATCAEGHRITTLYFDSEQREVARACRLRRNSVKLRARCYDESPLLWLELKTRRGASTHKLRRAILGAELGELLDEGVVSAQELERRGPRWGSEDLGARAAELCAAVGGGLRPDCIARYRRRAWQDLEGDTRVTLDTELAYFRAPAGLLGEGADLTAALDGEPLARAAHAVLEVKLRGPCPRWLHGLLGPMGLGADGRGPKRYSKFLAASGAVTG